MTWLDFTIVGLVAFSVILSLFRGYIREALSLLGWIVALWCGFSFAHDGAEFLAAAVDDGGARTGIALATIVFVVLLLVGMVNFVVGRYLLSKRYTAADRVLATVFGGARGCLIVVALVLLAGMVRVPEHATWEASRVVPYFQMIAVQIREVLPNELANGIQYPGGK
ncbi:MAG: CvpA family protein [Gammaproteobacteria bacterium]|nr:CvpA family protein [Gammaproteobacteria bacterium]